MFIYCTLYSSTLIEYTYYPLVSRVCTKDVIKCTGSRENFALQPVDFGADFRKNSQDRCSGCLHFACSDQCFPEEVGGRA